MFEVVEVEVVEEGEGDGKEVIDFLEEFSFCLRLGCWWMEGVLIEEEIWWFMDCWLRIVFVR